MVKRRNTFWSAPTRGQVEGKDSDESLGMLDEENAEDDETLPVLEDEEAEQREASASSSSPPKKRLNQRVYLQDQHRKGKGRKRSLLKMQKVLRRRLKKGSWKKS